MIVVGVIIVLVVLTAVIANGIEDYNSSIINFNSSDKKKLDLPIITLENNSKKFNFLVDTGANLSLLNLVYMEEFEYEELNAKGTIFGMEGNVQSVTYVRVILHRREDSFLNTFQVVDLSTAFGKVNEEYGIEVHGILGNDFLIKYNCIINYPKSSIRYGRKD